MASVGTMKKIKIIRMGSTADAGGFQKPSETVLWAGWAKVRQANGFREFTQGLTGMGYVKEFEIRNDRTITHDSDTRIVYAGRRYTVNSIEPKQEKRFWWIIRATAISE